MPENTVFSRRTTNPRPQVSFIKIIRLDADAVQGVANYNFVIECENGKPRRLLPFIRV
jgi:hypothetical protein